MRLVIALGGNALLHRGEPPEAATQAARLAVAAPALARLAATHQVVFVHGNGPQIGLLARESAADPSLAAPYPLGLLSAATQGLIGSLLQQALHGADPDVATATVVTHVSIDSDDPALLTPEKFIGNVYDEHHARALARKHGWSIAPDGDGWRRVVSSPRPRQILEIDTCRTLLNAGTTVIMGGGGGIPLTHADDSDQLVDAVIDKDHTAALLGRLLHADKLVILTDVPGVIIGYRTPDATVLTDTTPPLARALDLPAGSMRPKVEAACDFVTVTGRPAVIGPLEHAEDVVAGVLGTRVNPAGQPDGAPMGNPAR
ncbi:gamma-glutamyl kinase [Leifsonia xyli subsp. cynodontis DSM 46306]|uniref:Carbamate kinase n=1 Tax=Leifsonia xyli subsp. cynodontis DSM 46306 TaxID=1389489 RepID=U3P816_LEIXC|nr:carbamate kinase [Leifsonia xyli]AGW41082.1 gamma-glutamyl kinase [Leifsonia xyli subsp. cynodontis DSM 46306]